MTLVDCEIAVRAFGQGFAAGSDPLRGTRRTVVEPNTHRHWMVGFDAGRAAAQVAEAAFRSQLKETE